MKDKIKVFFINFILIAILSKVDIFAGPYVLYEKNTEEVLTKNTKYISKEQVTSEGLRDIHVLKIPIKDENININNVFFEEDFSLKMPTSELLKKKGALAGVNADFFNLNGKYSISQGPIINESIVAVDNLNNLYKNEYATFYLTNEKSPFIEYIKLDIDFLNNGVENISVYHMNKVTDVIYPTYVDRNIMLNTTNLDNKIPNLTKIVVQDNKIVYISKKGENIDIPENGYIILLSNASADYQTTLVNIGDQAQIKISSAIDVDSLYTAIGGGAKLLQNGKLVDDSGFKVKGRAPRTAIGITKDREFVILVVVDGRTHSIGATHEELAQIMLKNGAHDAMHLDGGGSSTMVIKKHDEEEVYVVNTPSQGVERKVVNAVGIFNRSKPGKLNSIKLDFKSNMVITNTGIPYEFYGFDEYFNKVDFDIKKLKLASDDELGKFVEGYFIPSKSGKIIVTAQYEDIFYKTEIMSLKVAQLLPNTKSINSQIDEKTLIDFSAMSIDGSVAYVHQGIKFEVVPKDLGFIEGHYFIRKKNGSGHIRAYIDDVEYYVHVAAGHNKIQVTSFEEEEEFVFSKTPESVTGGIFVSEDAFDGKKAIELSYKFDISDVTQAAYLQFSKKYYFDYQTEKLGIFVKGDNSKNWIRASILDSQGFEFLVDIAREVDWSGYKNIEFNLPKNANYPVQLNKIYVVTIDSQSVQSSSLIFDNIYSLELIYEENNHPNNTVFQDILNKLPQNSQDYFTISVAANSEINNLKKDILLKDIFLENLQKETQLALILGKSGYEDQLQIPFYKHGNYYAFYEESNVGIMYMTNKAGSYYNSNHDQWLKFHEDLEHRNQKNIIISTDLNPISRQDRKEYYLIHQELVKHRKLGKNIFVVSYEGSTTSSKVLDGIRYINLGSLLNKNGDINKQFAILRFDAKGDEIYYYLKKIFEN